MFKKKKELTDEEGSKQKTTCLCWGERVDGQEREQGKRSCDMKGRLNTQDES